jgi:dihydroxy-acid dehydratase
MEVRAFNKKRWPSRYATDGLGHVPHPKGAPGIPLTMAAPHGEGAGEKVARQDGDIIGIDGLAGTISARVHEAMLAEQRKVWKPRVNACSSGATWKYARGVGPARKGAVTHPG